MLQPASHMSRVKLHIGYAKWPTYKLSTTVVLGWAFVHSPVVTYLTACVR